MRYLTKEDAEAAVWGGLVFGAGGGGLEMGLKSIDTIFSLGTPKLIGLDELPDDALGAVTTGVGAPGASGPRTTFPRDNVQAVDMLRARLRDGALGYDRDIVGTLVGHPGAWMVNSWLHSVLDETQYVIDTATNGRGHPSVRMGSMGITDALDHRILLTGVGGLDDVAGRIEVVIESPLSLGSDMLRRAAALLGGGIMAARGPFTVEFLKKNSAVGSISASIDLGKAMLDAAGKSASERIDAVVKALGGKVATEGRITSNTIELDGAYDVGVITLDASGKEVEVGVVNEYLTLDVAGERVATFPDLIVLFNASDGDPTTASPAKVGDDVVVVTVPRADIPVGAGVYERATYPGVEKLLGKEIASYL